MGGDDLKFQHGKAARYSVPVFGTSQIVVGGRPTRLTKADVAFLKKRWKEKIGRKEDRWVPLADLLE